MIFQQEIIFRFRPAKIKFVTSSRKLVYMYLLVKELIVKKVKRAYGF